MHIIFLSLAVWNTIFFAATVIFGWMAGENRDAWYVWHFTLGVVTGLFTCLTHSLVMIHFMGSGKGIKEAVENFNLPNDPQTGYVRRTRKFKARTSGLATMAAFSIIVISWLGAARDTDWLGLTPTWDWVHPWGGYLAIAFNIYAFTVEHRIIKENTEMIAEINALIERSQKTQNTTAGTKP
jgi:hypothetical protein